MQRRPTSQTSRCASARGRRSRSSPCAAKRVLLGQGAVLGAVVLAMLVREFPGLVREVRIWRMIGFTSGARPPQ
ncbi:hypothetical protein IHE61_25620 [Streptomyces sp. GKU 257-1]|nr:hypothetical protein [Streptomyces sp. GKU 257-1]